MMAGFTRTPSGLKAKYNFYSIPTIYVEGDDDIIFYKTLLNSYKCNFEVAGGAIECNELATELIQNDLPYIVIIDGDYGILSRKKSIHRRVVFLNRYSHENYFYEHSTILSICTDLSKCKCDSSSAEQSLAKVEEELVNIALELVILDIAHYAADTGKKIMPSKPQPLLTNQNPLKFNKTEISKICSKAKKNINQNHLNTARTIVADYLKNHSLLHLIRGHFIFGLVRLFLFDVVNKSCGRKPTLDNNSLRLLLSKEIWNSIPHSDHVNLKRRIVRSVKEVQSMLDKRAA